MSYQVEPNLKKFKYCIDGECGPKQLKYCVDGEWHQSKTSRHMECFNPSTGEVIALAPQCTADEVEAAISSAKAAFPSWAGTPPSKRVQVLFRMKALIDEHLEELTFLLCKEEGKAWLESMGDVLKVNEVVEFACGIPHLMKGESVMNVSSDYDTVLYNHPLGVFAAIPPWNFPAMIPHGWMAPLCIATGNTLVIKAASFVPQSAMRILELWHEAGLPKGVINIVTAARSEAELLLRHPDIVGVTFVGSTKVGRHIYATAAANGKRVQALCEAKNHALVLHDCKLERTAQGIINAFCGCAGERCMALPVVCVEDAVGDALVSELKKQASQVKLGPAWDPSTGMGPVVNAGHLKFVTDWIEKGVRQGAELLLDGRNPEVPRGCEKGFFIGPTILDHVKPEMSVGDQEIFGPVLCVKRVKDFEEGLAIMNASEFANGSVIYTQNGYYAREFASRTHAGMVGINVGIPVPLGIFGFTGHKNSFFGDLHVMGRDGIRFFTEQKNVTSTWFSEDAGSLEAQKVDTWDGTITSLPADKGPVR
jgi:malonate-semialdehyde dehydrogenase (acetylating)/methylmalonate-semialdehyde dehydrogenase